MMKIKDGVRFCSPAMAMCHATFVVDQVCRDFGVDCVITGGVEEHQHPSKHIYGGGLDYRTRDLIEGARYDFAECVAEALGDGFDVVLEIDHLHVEYDVSNLVV